MDAVFWLIGELRSKGVLLLQLLEELLHALIGKVASQTLDELDHDAGAGIAAGEDLTQARALDHPGVEFDPRRLQLRRPPPQIVDAHPRMLPAPTASLHDLRNPP